MSTHPTARFPDQALVRQTCVNEHTGAHMTRCCVRLAYASGIFAALAQLLHDMQSRMIDCTVPSCMTGMVRHRKPPSNRQVLRSIVQPQSTVSPIQASANCQTMQIWCECSTSMCWPALRGTASRAHERHSAHRCKDASASRSHMSPCMVPSH